MGKVGSCSVGNTLRAILSNQLIYNVHGLTIEGIKSTEAFQNKRYAKAHEVIDILSKYPFLRMKIITLVRDPVVTVISSVFQSFKQYFPNDNYSTISVGEIINKIVTVKPDYWLEWYSREFNKFCNFNIYSVPFMHSQGYQIYIKNNCDILLIRLENLNDCFNSAMSDFLNIDPDNILIHNSSAKKEYARMYSKVINTIKIPDTILDMYYSSNYARHFYTKKERGIFKKKWN